MNLHVTEYCSLFRSNILQYSITIVCSYGAVFRWSQYFSPFPEISSVISFLSWAVIKTEHSLDIFSYVDNTKLVLTKTGYWYEITKGLCTKEKRSPLSRGKILASLNLMAALLKVEQTSSSSKQSAFSQYTSRWPCQLRNNLAVASADSQ